MAEETGHRHAVEGAAGAGFGHMGVHVGVDPYQAQGTAAAQAPGGAAPGAGGASVIAAKHGEIAPLGHQIVDARGEAPAETGDGLQCGNSGLTGGRRQGAPPVGVDALVPQPGDQSALAQRPGSMLAAFVPGAASASGAENAHRPGFERRRGYLHQHGSPSRAWPTKLPRLKSYDQVVYIRLNPGIRGFRATDEGGAGPWSKGPGHYTFWAIFRELEQPFYCIT